MITALDNETGQGTCPSCKGRIWLPCPHDQLDADGWCVLCDTPGDTPDPTVQCPDCL